MMDEILDQLAGMTIYRKLKKDKAVQKMVSLLRKFYCKRQGQMQNFCEIAEDYSKLCARLFESSYQGSLPDYLFERVLSADNSFTLNCAQGKFPEISNEIKMAARFDLNAIAALAAITSEELKQAMADRFPEKMNFIRRLPDYSSESIEFQQTESWGEHLDAIAEYHRTNGISVFAKYYAFYLTDAKKVIPVPDFEPIGLASLKKYEVQKKQLVDNTLSFLHRKPANHVLLYGDRGTGKSTMVNAMLSEYHSQGLRMIQVKKEDIVSIQKVLEVVRRIPLRFIIFIDDLTFEENDECFNILKAVLEGSLNALPENVLIYATTNRRHMIKETFSSREGNELHVNDTRDENASLADRFGLTITFMKPNLPDFLEIVAEIAKERGLEIDSETLNRGANTFAMRKASRSGRVARQYVDYVEGRLGLNLPI